MIVLDTNVLSESLKPSPSASVLRWFAAQESSQLFTTSITQAEILSGLEIMPLGKRRAALTNAIEKIFDEALSGRILPFDQEAAHAFVQIVVARRSTGRPISQFDAMIAAIARSRGAAIATRDVRYFQRCGVDLINPWLE